MKLYVLIEALIHLWYLFLAVTSQAFTECIKQHPSLVELNMADNRLGE